MNPMFNLGYEHGYQNSDVFKHPAFSNYASRKTKNAEWREFLKGFDAGYAAAYEAGLIKTKPDIRDKIIDTAIGVTLIAVFAPLQFLYHPLSAIAFHTSEEGAPGMIRHIINVWKKDDGSIWFRKPRTISNNPTPSTTPRQLPPATRQLPPPSPRTAARAAARAAVNSSDNP